MKSTEKGLIKSRFIFLLGLISLMLLGLFIRSFYLQYLESDFLNTEGEKKHIKYKLVLASLFTALVFLFIAPFFKFYIQDRILFMLIPILIPVYMLGTKNIPKAVCWAIGILNIATAYLIYKHDFNILYINFIISLIICIYIFRHPILHFRRIKTT